METVRFLNVDILSLTQNELLQKLDKGVLITPNIDQLVKLQHDEEFYHICKKAEWVVCDSLLRLATDKELRKRFSQESYRLIKASFSLDANIQKLKGIYRHMINRPNSDGNEQT